MRPQSKASPALKLFPFFIALLVVFQPAFAAVTNARLFGYAEANYPSLFGGTSAAGQVTYQGREYSYRYYPASNNYLAIDSSGLISLLGDDTDGDLIVVGSVSAFEPIITDWEASPAGTLAASAGSATSYQAAYDECYVGTPAYYTSTYCAAYANAIMAGSTLVDANQAGATAAGYSVVGTAGMGETITITDTGTPYASGSGSATSYQAAYDSCYNGTPLLYTRTYCAAYANAIVAGSTPAAANQAGAVAAGSNVGNIGMGQTITATGTPYSGSTGSTSSTGSTGGTGVSQIRSINTSATSEHVLVVKTDGTVWAWGSNEAGQLGPQTSSYSTSSTPVQVSVLGSSYESVAIGWKQSFAFGPETYMMAWGYNTYGVLGDGTTTLRTSPVQAAMVSNSQQTYALGGFKSVATGPLFTVAVRTDGSLWGWGSMLYHSPQQPYRPNNIGSGYDSVSVGLQHVVALKSDGSVWTWGYGNDWGQLGRIVQSAATSSGTDAETPTQILTGVSRVWSGARSGYALKNDGSLWAWGSNTSGQLGDGTTTQRNTPIQVAGGFSTIAAGGTHVAALKSDGSLWTWGDNSYGQLADGTTTNSSIPKKVGDGYALVGAGGTFTLAADTAGEIFGAGWNYWGQLGNGTQTDAAVTTLTKALSLGNTGTSGGSSTGGSTDACSAQPYVGGAGDPQVDTFCQIAQFDACMYSATGNSAYITDRNNQCTVLNGFLPYLSTVWSCRYCP
jgi:alpha-tubulin suppressor-like RCC1 family protein